MEYENYQTYQSPSPIVLSEGNIVIPAWQQRTMADRKLNKRKHENYDR